MKPQFNPPPLLWYFCHFKRIISWELFDLFLLSLRNHKCHSFISYWWLSKFCWRDFSLSLVARMAAPWCSSTSKLCRSALWFRSYCCPFFFSSWVTTRRSFCKKGLFIPPTPLSSPLGLCLVINILVVGILVINRHWEKFFQRPHDGHQMFTPKNATAYGGDLECGGLKRNLFVSLRLIWTLRIMWVSLLYL